MPDQDLVLEKGESVSQVEEKTGPDPSTDKPKSAPVSSTGNSAETIRRRHIIDRDFESAPQNQQTSQTPRSPVLRSSSARSTAQKRLAEERRLEAVEEDRLQGIEKNRAKRKKKSLKKKGLLDNIQDGEPLNADREMAALRLDSQRDRSKEADPTSLALGRSGSRRADSDELLYSNPEQQRRHGVGNVSVVATSTDAGSTGQDLAESTLRPEKTPDPQKAPEPIKPTKEHEDLAERYAQSLYGREIDVENAYAVLRGRSAAEIKAIDSAYREIWGESMLERAATRFGANAPETKRFEYLLKGGKALGMADELASLITAKRVNVEAVQKLLQNANNSELAQIIRHFNTFYAPALGARDFQDALNLDRKRGQEIETEATRYATERGKLLAKIEWGSARSWEKRNFQKELDALDEKYKRFIAGYQDLLIRYPQLEGNLTAGITKIEQESKTRMLSMLKNARESASTIQDSFGFWNDDENTIYATLRGKSPEEIELIISAYNRQYGDFWKKMDSLDSDETRRVKHLCMYIGCENELSDWARKINERHKKDYRARGQADLLYTAMAGSGTDEDTIRGVFRDKSPEEIKAIKDAFKGFYSSRYGASLYSALRSELSGDTEDELIAMYRGNKHLSNAVRIKDATDGWLGLDTDESTVYELLGYQPGADLKQQRKEIEETYKMVQAYENRYGGSGTRLPELQLDEVSNDNLSSYLEQLYSHSALVRRLNRSMSGADLDKAIGLLTRNDARVKAASIKIAVGGLGTDERTVWNTLQEQSREEMQALALEYERLYGSRRSYQRVSAEIREGKYGNSKLNRDIDADMSGYDYYRARALIDNDRLLADVYEIEDSIYGIGCDIEGVRAVIERVASRQDFENLEVPALRRKNYESEEAFAEAQQEAYLKALSSAQQAYRDKIREVYRERNGKTIEDAILTQWSVNGDHARIIGSLLDDGELTDCEKLRDAVLGWGGTKIEVIEEVLSGKTKEEIEELEKEYRQTWKTDLRGDLFGDLSGADQFEAEQWLKGIPVTAADYVDRYEARYAFERSGFLNWGDDIVLAFDGEREGALERHRRAILEAYNNLSESQKNAPIDPALLNLIESGQLDLHSLRATKEAAAEIAAEVAGIGASVAVAIVYPPGGGAMAYIILAGEAAGASVAARTTTRLLIKGKGYSLESLGDDVIRGSLDGVSMAAGVGVGNAARNGIVKGLQVMKGIDHAAAEALVENSFVLRAVSRTVEGAADGAVGGGLASGTFRAIDSNTWADGFEEGIRLVLVDTGRGAAIGGVTGAVMGGGIELMRNPVKGAWAVTGAPVLKKTGISDKIFKLRAAKKIGKEFNRAELSEEAEKAVSDLESLERQRATGVTSEGTPLTKSAKKGLDEQITAQRQKIEDLAKTAEKDLKRAASEEFDYQKALKKRLKGTYGDEKAAEVAERIGKNEAALKDPKVYGDPKETARIRAEIEKDLKELEIIKQRIRLERGTSLQRFKKWASELEGPHPIKALKRSWRHFRDDFLPKTVNELKIFGDALKYHLSHPEVALRKLGGLVSKPFVGAARGIQKGISTTLNISVHPVTSLRSAYQKTIYGIKSFIREKKIDFMVLGTGNSPEARAAAGTIIDKSKELKKTGAASARKTLNQEIDEARRTIRSERAERVVEKKVQKHIERLTRSGAVAEPARTSHVKAAVGRQLGFKSPLAAERAKAASSEDGRAAGPEKSAGEKSPDTRSTGPENQRKPNDGDEGLDGPGETKGPDGGPDDKPGGGGGDAPKKPAPERSPEAAGPEATEAQVELKTEPKQPREVVDSRPEIAPQAKKLSEDIADLEARLDPSHPEYNPAEKKRLEGTLRAKKEAFERFKNEAEVRRIADLKRAKRIEQLSKDTPDTPEVRQAAKRVAELEERMAERKAAGTLTPELKKELQAQIKTNRETLATARKTLAEAKAVAQKPFKKPALDKDEIAKLKSEVEGTKLERLKRERLIKEAERGKRRTAELLDGTRQDEAAKEAAKRIIELEKQKAAGSLTKEAKSEIKVEIKEKEAVLERSRRSQRLREAVRLRRLRDEAEITRLANGTKDPVAAKETAEKIVKNRRTLRRQESLSTRDEKEIGRLEREIEEGEQALKEIKAPKPEASAPEAKTKSRFEELLEGTDRSDEAGRAAKNIESLERQLKIRREKAPDSVVEADLEEKLTVQRKILERTRRRARTIEKGEKVAKAREARIKKIMEGAGNSAEARAAAEEIDRITKRIEFERDTGSLTPEAEKYWKGEMEPHYRTLEEIRADVAKRESMRPTIERGLKRRPELRAVEEARVRELLRGTDGSAAATKHAENIASLERKLQARARHGDTSGPEVKRWKDEIRTHEDALDLNKKQLKAANARALELQRRAKAARESGWTRERMQGPALAAHKQRKMLEAVDQSGRFGSRHKFNPAESEERYIFTGEILPAFDAIGAGSEVIGNAKIHLAEMFEAGELTQEHVYNLYRILKSKGMDEVLAEKLSSGTLSASDISHAARRADAVEKDIKELEAAFTAPAVEPNRTVMREPEATGITVEELGEVSSEASEIDNLMAGSGDLPGEQRAALAKQRETIENLKQERAKALKELDPERAAAAAKYYDDTIEIELERAREIAAGRDGFGDSGVNSAAGSPDASAGGGLRNKAQDTPAGDSSAQPETAGGTQTAVLEDTTPMDEVEELSADDLQALFDAPSIEPDRTVMREPEAPGVTVEEFGEVSSKASDIDKLIEASKHPPGKQRAALAKQREQIDRELEEAWERAAGDDGFEGGEGFDFEPTLPTGGGEGSSPSGAGGYEPSGGARYSGSSQPSGTSGSRYDTRYQPEAPRRGRAAVMEEPQTSALNAQRYKPRDLSPRASKSKPHAGQAFDEPSFYSGPRSGLEPEPAPFAPELEPVRQPETQVAVMEPPVKPKVEPSVSNPDAPPIDIEQERLVLQRELAEYNSGNTAALETRTVPKVKPKIEEVPSPVRAPDPAVKKIVEAEPVLTSHSRPIPEPHYLNSPENIAAPHRAPTPEAMLSPDPVATPNPAAEAHKSILEEELFIRQRQGSRRTGRAKLKPYLNLTGSKPVDEWYEKRIMMLRTRAIMNRYQAERSKIIHMGGRRVYSDVKVQYKSAERRIAKASREGPSRSILYGVPQDKDGNRLAPVYDDISGERYTVVNDIVAEGSTEMVIDDSGYDSAFEAEGF